MIEMMGRSYSFWAPCRLLLCRSQTWLCRPGEHLSAWSRAGAVQQLWAQLAHWDGHPTALHLAKGVPQIPGSEPPDKGYTIVSLLKFLFSPELYF